MKKFSFRKSLSFVLASLASTCLPAITYYVSPSGNDNAAGTSQSTAWQSISKVNSLNIQPGTTILFEGGATFSGSLYFDSQDANDTTNKVIISSYGNGRATVNSGVSTGFYAYNTQGFTVSNLVFLGSGMTGNTAYGMLLFTDLPGDVKLGGISIKNVEIHNYGRVGISIGSGYNNTGFQDLTIEGAHIYNVQENGITTWGYTSQTHVGWAHRNISIKKTHVHNITGYADANQHRGSGIIMGQVDKGLIENTVAHDNGALNIHCGGPGGIWAWDCNNITIQYCESYHNLSGTGCDGLGFDFDGGVTNSLMQYNYSHDNDGAGYLLGQYDYARPWSNNVVRYNISENDGHTNSGGITLFKGAGTTMNGVKIYNNTVYSSPFSTNPAIGAFKITTWNTGITGVEVYNNIFETTGGVPLVDIPAGYSAYFAGNLYWAGSGVFQIKYQGTVYNTISSWRSATNNEKVGTLATGIMANPALSGAGSGVTVYPNATSQLSSYKLLSGSPAIDAGLNLASNFSISAGSHDFFNNPNSAGSAPDIGAFESAAAPVATGGINVHGMLSEETVSVYPNPIRSGEMIRVSGAEGPYDVELVSLTGATLWKETRIEIPVYEFAVNVPSQAIYLVTVTDSKGVRVTKKIMIQ